MDSLSPSEHFPAQIHCHAVCHDILYFSVRVLDAGGAVTLRRIFRFLPEGSETRENRVVPTTTRIQRRYDHRFRDLVQTTGAPELAIQHGVPRSTASGWRTKTITEVVSLDVLELDTIRLQHEVILLRRQIARLLSLLRLFVIALKVSGISFTRVRLPEGTAKLQLLRAIERSCSHFPLRTVLRAIGLSHARYHDWIRADRCGLDDRPSCPRSSPQQLTLNEVNIIRDMVTSNEYRHVSTGVLARLAQRLGKVFASPTTWYWFEITNGDGLGSVFIRPSRRSASEPHGLTRSGMSTRH